jgi:hypothetical protein
MQLSIHPLKVNLKRITRIGLSLVFAVQLIPAAEAALVTFRFEGFVSSTNKPAVFPLGQGLNGTYTFDSETPDQNPGNPDQGVYAPVVVFPYTDSEGGVRRFSFTSGSYTATGIAPDLTNAGGGIIVNKTSSFEPVSSYEVVVDVGNSPLGPDVNGEQLVSMWLSLQDATGRVPDSIDLPLTPPNLDDFTSTAFGLFFDADATGPAPPLGGSVVFTVTSLAPIPVPPAFYLFGSGLLGLVGMARRRKAA